MKKPRHSIHEQPNYSATELKKIQDIEKKYEKDGKDLEPDLLDEQPLVEEVKHHVEAHENAKGPKKQKGKK